MVALNQVIKEFAISGRGIDTEGTRASRIGEEIVEGFVIGVICLWSTNLDGAIDLGHSTVV